jgi:predicted PurR-regulated permease PerM
LVSLDRIAKSVRQYLWIQTLLSLLTGVLVSISLAIIGVDYPVLWGIVAFLLNYIPNIGSIIAAIPTILFALIQLGPGAAFWTAIIYLAINMVVGNIIQPKVMGKGLGLSTLVVFLSLLVWGFIFGTIGMFLSVPLSMSIKIILEQNQNTKWLAVMMGTEEEAKSALHSP